MADADELGLEMLATTLSLPGGLRSGRLQPSAGQDWSDCRCDRRDGYWRLCSSTRAGWPTSAPPARFRSRPARRRVAAPVGHARPHWVRLLNGRPVRLSSRRVRCGKCRLTHVCSRGWAARLRQHPRSVAAELGVPADTVRGWLRRFTAGSRIALPPPGRPRHDRSAHANHPRRGVSPVVGDVELVDRLTVAAES
jgi:hypothetical protein